MNRAAIFFGGLLLATAATALWHGPLGTGEKLATQIETNTRAQLDYDEMTQVQAKIERDPLVRIVHLSGPADNFQRGEIVRRMEALPGVGEARWDAGSLPMEQRR